VPFANRWAGTADQLPRETTVLRVWTDEPDVIKPEKTLTLTAGESQEAVPAVPENLGLLSRVVLPLTGCLNDTAGGTVSTIHDARAGVGSTWPAALVARTSKPWRPSTSAM
jgi:hypothetical protein